MLRCFLIFFVSLMVPALLQSAGAPTSESTADEAVSAGVQALRAGDAVTAEQEFRAAIKARPQFAEAYLNLGLAQQQGGKMEQAAASLEKAITLKPNLRGAHLFLGILEYQANQLAKAETALRRETELSPKDAKAWMWLGVDELAEAHPEDAASVLDTAARLAPSDPDILYHRGRAHLLVSEDSYQQMFKLDPDSYRVHQVLGQADAEADRRAEAISEYKLALARAPQAVGLHEALADLYWTDGKMELAEPEYLQELRVNPGSASANYKLGGLRVIGGNPGAAVEPLKRALALDPSFAKATYYLGRAYVDQGRDTEGIPYLEQATKAQGDETLNTLAWYQLARVYRRHNQPAEADAALGQFRVLRAQLKQRQDAKSAAQKNRQPDLPRPEEVPATDAAQP